ncbi:DUF6458 family protein [Rathayibacter caricis]|uniref:DUF6458 family protein n=1 Tax=Rathayibacter caricis TaxID=110936 RepID=UPI001FB3EC98|nr:DUF6458 family protein [Rathayibacter caricis]MCJ1698035.1 DUF6458 family protein [Rathayibacter caricis]
MSIGSGIVLFVIGAVLAFAVNIETNIVDLHMIGCILMGAGLIIFILGLAFTFRRRRCPSGMPASDTQLLNR